MVQAGSAVLITEHPTGMDQGQGLAIFPPLPPKFPLNGQINLPHSTAKGTDLVLTLALLAGSCMTIPIPHVLSPTPVTTAPCGRVLWTLLYFWTHSSL